MPAWPRAQSAPWPAPRSAPMPDKQPANFATSSSFQFSFVEIAALAPFDYATSLRAGQDGQAGKVNEQTVFNPARDQAEQARQTRRIGDAPEMGIDNPVAAIGDKNVAILALAEPHLPGNTALGKCRGNRPLGGGQSERKHLHR